MLEERQKQDVIYLSIVNGSLERWMGEGEPQKSYSKVGGHVVSLFKNTKKIKDRERNAEKDVMFLYVRMVDGDENISVQVPMYSSAGPDILRSLLFATRNGMDFVTKDNVVIEVYQVTKDGGRKFTNAKLLVNDKKLDWVQLPNGYSKEAALDMFYNEIVDFIKLKKAVDDDDLPLGTPAEGAPTGGFHDFGSNPFDNHR